MQLLTLWSVAAVANTIYMPHTWCRRSARGIKGNRFNTTAGIIQPVGGHWSLMPFSISYCIYACVVLACLRARRTSRSIITRDAHVKCRESALECVTDAVLYRAVSSLIFWFNASSNPNYSCLRDRFKYSEGIEQRTMYHFRSEVQRMRQSKIENWKEKINSWHPLVCTIILQHSKISRRNCSTYVESRWPSWLEQLNHHSIMVWFNCYISMIQISRASRTWREFILLYSETIHISYSSRSVWNQSNAGTPRSPRCSISDNDGI